MKANIFDIKHFAVHDGPGIRTTVFFKGCPLKCIWCHNPESISGKKQLGFIEHKCTSCGRCVAACKSGAHYFDEQGIHRLDREKCLLCGECESACFSKALTLYGKEVELDAIVSELMEDADFYESSGGGVTLSGGECLLQADACAELLRSVKEKGIHTAIDTCGFVSSAALDKVIPYTDLFLYDMKALDQETHRSCTGQSNALILENIGYLSERGCPIEVRIPFVPEKNADQVASIGEFLRSVKTLVGVRVLPYHNYAGTKYSSLGMENTLPASLPDADELMRAKQTLRDLGITVLE